MQCNDNDVSSSGVLLCNAICLFIISLLQCIAARFKIPVLFASFALLKYHDGMIDVINYYGFVFAKFLFKSRIIYMMQCIN